MEVILLKDVRALGKRGQVVKVRPGFARNYLLPQKSALLATTGNIAYFDQQKKKIEAAHAKSHAEAVDFAAQIGETTITLAKRVGERDTLYGSVTVADIVDALAHKGIVVDKRMVELPGSAPTLKKVGDYKVKVDLHSDVTAEFTVSIVPAD